MSTISIRTITPDFEEHLQVQDPRAAHFLASRVPDCGLLDWGSVGSPSGFDVLGKSPYKSSLVVGQQAEVHVGNYDLLRDGPEKIEQHGKQTHTHTGNLTYTRNGNETHTNNGNITRNMNGNLTTTTLGTQMHTFTGAVTETHAQNRNLSEPAQRFEWLNGDAKITFWARGFTIIKTEGTLAAVEFKGAAAEIKLTNPKAEAWKTKVHGLDTKVHAFIAKMGATGNLQAKLNAGATFALNSIAF